MPDDFGNTPATATALTPGTPVSGVLETTDDIDVFRVTAPGDGEGTHFRFTIDAAFDTPSVWESFLLTSESGEPLTFSYVAGGAFDAEANVDETQHTTQARVSVGAEPGQIIVLQVQDPGTASADASYTVRVDTVPDDHGDTQADASVLTVGSPASGLIATFTDSDVFRIAATPGIPVTVLLDGDGASETPELTFPRLSLSGPGVNYFGGDFNNPGYDVRHSFIMPASGEVYASVSATVGGMGYYSLSVTETVLIDDFPNTPETTGRVVVGGSAQGEIETPDDVDWFRVTLEAGATYIIDLEGTPTNRGTLRDTFLNPVLDPTGTRQVTRADDDSGTGHNSRLAFSPAEDGEYFIAARAFLERTGTYTVTVTELEDDYPDDTSTTGLLTIGTPTSGQTDYPYLNEIGVDSDWFRTDLEAGTLYRFRAEQATNPGQFHAVPNIHLQPGQGGQQNAIAGSQLFAPREDDTYFLSVTGFFERGYTLTGEVLFEGFDFSTSNLFFAGTNASQRGTRGDELVIGQQTDDYLRGVGGGDTLVGFEGDDLLVADETRPATSHNAATAASVYRAFQFLLGRDPDAQGLDDLAGRTLWGNTLARIIVDGQEFQTLHGDMTDAAFVDFLYGRLRGPDAASAEETAALLQVVESRGRAEAARIVINSDEYRNTLGGRDMAFLFTDPNPQSEFDVFGLYQAVLGRAPDATGFGRWDAALDNGLSLSQLAERFLGSREFTAQGNLSDRAFASLILTNLGGAAPATAVLDQAEALLAAGVSRADFAAAQTLLHRVDPTDWIRSFGTDDILIGGSGDNILIGGGLSDTFVFQQADAGFHRIFDFQAWDRIDLTDFGFADQQAARDAFTQVGNGMVFAQGDVTILVRDAGPDVLTTDDFLV